MLLLLAEGMHFYLYIRNYTIQHGSIDKKIAKSARYRYSYSSHNDGCDEVVWPRHNRLAMEQNTHIIEFQDIGFATKFRGVVDTHPILDKRFIAAEIAWFAGIDRYLEEGAASAT